MPCFSHAGLSCPSSTEGHRAHVGLDDDLGHEGHCLVVSTQQGDAGGEPGSREYRGMGLSGVRREMTGIKPTRVCVDLRIRYSRYVAELCLK